MTTTMTLNIYWRYILAAVSGALYFLAFVGFDQWYLAWVCLVPLLFALEGVSAKRGFFIGWLFGAVAFTGGFYWVVHTIHVFAFMPWPVAAAGCLLLCIAQATEFAAFAFLYVWLRKKTRRSPVFLATIAFVTAEFTSPQLFPHYFGNSQYLWLHVIQISDLTGVLGVSALLVLVNAAIYMIVSGIVNEMSINWRAAVSAGAVVLLVVGYGYLRIPVVKGDEAKSPNVRFGIAQANMGIYEKEENPEKAIAISQEMSLKLKNDGAQIVVWPETAVQEPVLHEDAQRLPDEVFGSIGVPIITGAIQRGKGTPYRPLYNVALLADEQGGIIGAYKKQKLLTFGEHIPLGDTFPVLYKWFPYIGRFTTGDSNEPLRFREFLLSVNICYEDILPRLIRKMMASGPNVIINITNDNWFGVTHEPMQHLVLAAFRSVEHRRWLVRSTNTGISAFVDATGNIVSQSPLMGASVLIADVPMMRGETVYARLGDWFAWLCIVMAILLGLGGFKKRGDICKNSRHG